MNMRLIWAAGLLAALGGCATYDYAGGSQGGYYRGSPSVEYRYPAGYYDGYSPYGYGGYYGYGSGYYGYDGPYYRDYYRPPRYYPRPPRPRPGDGEGRPPDRPPPPSAGGGGGTKVPWRDMDRLRRPPGRAAIGPQPRASSPQPQSAQPARPATVAPRASQPRPSAPRPGNLGRSNGTRRTLEP
ncbi:hypothetical protein JR065_05705 [Xanthomonas sp. AmX2]|uniref:hypothetical protein n=1 Tax=Xanthomonas sp. TaxID=29446 RepID=UPI0019813444|nr:hypothetical protein [Xanthomonas sp.]MBN6149826.1 hypothetical protein [Xanthomonas sp.]